MDITTYTLGAHTSLVLTDNHRIYLEGCDGRDMLARVIVNDVDALVRGLRELDLERSENVARQEREDRASEPIDDVTRQAVFARLREVYGKLSDERRLEIVSELADHPIWSMSRRGNMTMAHAHRVLNVLSTLPSRA